jgi:hypothetical protein
MAITKVGELAFSVASGSGSENKTLPGPPIANDLVIVHIVGDGALAIGDILTSGYTNIVTAAADAPGSVVARKFMGSTPDTVVNIDQKTANYIAGTIQVWRGVDLTTPLDAAVVSATGASGQPDPGSFTTVTANAMRIVVGGLDDDDATVSAAPSTFGDLISSNTGQASTTIGATSMMASLLAASPGALDPGAFTTSGTDAWVAYHFALRPAVTGVSGSLTGTEGADAASIAGDVIVSGSASGTDGADIAAFAGDVIVSGTLAATDGADAAALAGTVAFPVISGSLEGTEGADTAALTGTVLVSGALAADDGADSAEFAGNVSLVPVTGSLEATEGADGAALAGSVTQPASTATSSGSATTWNPKTLSRIAREAKRAKSARKARPIIIREIGAALGGTDDARAAAAEAASETLTSAPITQDTVAEVYALAELILARMDEEDAEMLLLSAA